MLSRRQPIYLTTFNLPLSSVFRKFFKFFFKTFLPSRFGSFPAVRLCAFFRVLAYITTFFSLLSTLFRHFSQIIFSFFENRFFRCFLTFSVFASVKPSYRNMLCPLCGSYATGSIRRRIKRRFWKSATFVPEKESPAVFPAGDIKSIGSRIFAYSLLSR